MSKPRVAFLGLGIMGGGMAGRLLGAEFPVSVFNRSRERAEPFSKSGAFVASSPREAVSRSEIVISMVADDAASRNVWLGDAGALAGAVPGSVLIESSTLSVSWVKELAALVTSRNCELLDAPVTGTKPHAAAGELFFMVGGSAAALGKVRDVLAVLGREVIHLGPTGSGALVKLINNFVCGVQAASFAEALALVNVSGLDREKCIAVLSNSALASPLIKRMLGSMAADDFTPNFPLRLMAKDIGYAIGEGVKSGLALRTAAPALDVFKHAVAEGLGDQDFSAVVKSVKHS
ncbi:MAG TPA: NAD(P)-dependent oxidoreductase [Candidatus Sulfotelmatobacter sp.]|nr:NAD(P)-dependent oxidoreductase [Candidatus Sulfotelmatobacter sp.]